jgi:uncharacterized DUF497 family protein
MSTDVQEYHGWGAMRVDWDPAKYRSNFWKHGVRFEDAQVVFDDEGRIEVHDDRGYGEERWAVIGSTGQSIVYVIYTERDGDMRLISARKADPHDEADSFSNKAWR